MPTLRIGTDGKDQSIDLTDPTASFKPGRGIVTYRHLIDSEFVAPGIYRKKGLVARVSSFSGGFGEKDWVHQHLDIKGPSVKQVRQFALDILAYKLDPTDPWGQQAEEVRAKLGLVDGSR